MIKKKTTAKKTAPKKAPPKKKTAKSAPKKKSTSTTAKGKADEPSVTILQTSKCQSMSGKSTLTYNIGVDDEDRVYIRINANSGGGYWSKEWVAIEEIKALVGDATDEKPIASFQLQPLFKAKSVNTPSFLLAVLLKEKVLRTVPKLKRVYAYAGDAGEKAFLAKVDKLKTSKKAK